MFENLYTDKDKALLKQYGEYMKSAGFYSLGGEVNCWRFKYGEDSTDTFWIVDLYCEGSFSPRIYQFRWEFDGINYCQALLQNKAGILFFLKDFYYWGFHLQNFLENLFLDLYYCYYYCCYYC